MRSVGDLGVQGGCGEEVGVMFVVAAHYAIIAPALADAFLDQSDL